MASTQKRSTPGQQPITLAIDIGGSGIKGILLSTTGQPIGERLRIVTPQPSTPQAVFTGIAELVQGLGSFDRVSVGFPGVIHQGQVKTAPNLDASWPETNLVKELERQLKKPVRAANDADVQGYGAIKGQGVELVITLGTGFGTALFVNGHLVPNLEIAHHPFRKRQTYEVQLGANALKAVGKKRWNLRLAKAIDLLDRVINFDHPRFRSEDAERELWADPNVILPPATKSHGKGTAQKRAPRKKSSKALQKKRP